MNPTILFVDDEPAVTAALKRTLRSEPWRILETHSGPEALQVLDRDGIDAVISDERLQGMSGWELLATVRRLYPDVVRILLIGHAGLEAASRATSEGQIYRFFLKPCNGQELIYGLRQGLQRRALEAEISRTECGSGDADELQALERENPGITKVARDPDGTIVIEDGDA